MCNPSLVSRLSLECGYERGVLVVVRGITSSTRVCEDVLVMGQGSVSIGVAVGVTVGMAIGMTIRVAICVAVRVAISIKVVFTVGTRRRVSYSIRKRGSAHDPCEVGLLIEARGLNDTRSRGGRDTLEGVLVLRDFDGMLRERCPNLIVRQVWLSRVGEQGEHSSDALGRARFASRYHCLL